MYCYWNKIPQRRGKWIICSWNSRLATTSSMRSMAFRIARSMPKSQQQVNCQGFIIWSHGKATLRRKILRSLHRQSSIFEGLSPPTTRTIQRSQQRPLSPLIRLHQLLGSRKVNLLGPRRRWQRNVANLLAPPLPTNRRKSLKPLSCSISPGFLPKKYPTCRLGGFSPITLHRSFRFFSSVFSLG